MPACQNGESLIATIRKVRQIFGSNNVANLSTVERIIDKIETTASVSDLKPTTHTHSGRSEQNINAVCMLW